MIPTEWAIDAIMQTPEQPGFCPLIIGQSQDELYTYLVTEFDGSRVNAEVDCKPV